MDDRVLLEGGDNGTAAPGQMGSTIWIPGDQINTVQRYLAKPDQPGWPSLADAFAVGVPARAAESVEARRRGSD